MTNDLKIHHDFCLSGWASYIKSGTWINPYLNNSDEYWMAECLFEAMKSFPSAAPNPSVGAVYVKDGREVCRGHTQSFGKLHAEIHALTQIDRTALRGAKLYVSLEPCAHSGKQPPCTETLVQLGLEEVIIAIADPNPLVSGKGIEILKKAGIKTKCGILNSEAFMMNLAFFHGLKTGKAAFFLKWAQSLDGALADHQGQSKWITGEESRHFTHFLRSRYDAILVGAQTVLQDQPSLTTRHPTFPQKPNAIRVIYDPKARLADSIPDSIKKTILDKTFSSEAKTILITSDSNSEFHKSVERNGCLVMKKTTERFIGDLDEILASDSVIKYCGKQLSSILVEGGSQLLSSFIMENKFAAIHCFIAPTFLGGQNKILNSQFLDLKSAKRLHSTSSFKLGSDILFEMISDQYD